MPYYIRARTYYRYAEEHLAAAEESRDPARVCELALAAVDRAVRALWAIVQVEAPKESPDPEAVLAALDQAVEPWLAGEIRKARRRIADLARRPGPGEAREALELARFVLRRAKEVLEPVLGPGEGLLRKRGFYLA